MKPLAPHQRAFLEFILKYKYLGAFLTYSVTFTTFFMSSKVVSLIFQNPMGSSSKIMIYSIFGIFYSRMMAKSSLSEIAPNTTE
ncbi:hypothetical protein V2O64_21470 [Verrucomicrobiaceae bacterium 227]